MMAQPKIAPSMMVVNTFDTEQALEAFEAARIELLHIDVMDGEFVPNVMLGTNYVRDLRGRTSIPLDLHLMVNEPEGKGA